MVSDNLDMIKKWDNIKDYIPRERESVVLGVFEEKYEYEKIEVVLENNCCHSDHYFFDVIGYSDENCGEVLFVFHTLEDLLNINDEYNKSKYNPLNNNIFWDFRAYHHMTVYESLDFKELLNEIRNWETDDLKKVYAYLINNEYSLTTIYKNNENNLNYCLRLLTPNEIVQLCNENDMSKKYFTYSYLKKFRTYDTLLEAMEDNHFMYSLLCFIEEGYIQTIDKFKEIIENNITWNRW